MYIPYKNAHGVLLIKAQDFIKLHVISRPGNVTFLKKLVLRRKKNIVKGVIKISIRFFVVVWAYLNACFVLY